MTWIGDAGQVGGAIASAAAATAAWRAVAGTKRAAEQSMQPVLTGVVINNQPRDDDPPGTPVLVGVELRNVGPGVAKRPGCWISAFGKLLRAEYAGDGFLEPGSAMDIVTPIVGPAEDGDVAAMLWCRDHQELLHVWTHLGQHRVYKPKFWQEPWQVSVKYEDMWNSLFPALPHSGLLDLVNSPGRWTKRRATDHAPVNFDDRQVSPLPPDTRWGGLARRLRFATRSARRSWEYTGEDLPPPPPRS